MLFDDIKNYLQTRISQDDDLSVSIGIKEQYPYGYKAQPPEILIAIMDNTENQTATTFQAEKVSTVLLQVIVMANSMSIAGKKYNAQKSCNILSDKVCGWFDKNTIKQNLPQIINSRRVQWSNSFPYESGTVAYYSILRFNLMVTK